MFRSPFPDMTIPNVSVYDFLFGDLGRADLDRIALVDGTSGAETTYRQLVGQINLLAGALAARGVGPGDVVGLLCPNVPAFATVFHGILRSGATATTINSLATGHDIANQLTDAKATWLFTVSPLLPGSKEAAELLGLADDHVIVLDGAEGTRRYGTCSAKARPPPRSPSIRPLTSPSCPTHRAPPARRRA